MKGYWLNELRNKATIDEEKTYLLVDDFLKWLEKKFQ